MLNRRSVLCVEFAKLECGLVDLHMIDTTREGREVDGLSFPVGVALDLAARGAEDAHAVLARGVVALDVDDVLTRAGVKREATTISLQTIDARGKTEDDLVDVGETIAVGAVLLVHLHGVARERDGLDLARRIRMGVMLVGRDGDVISCGSTRRDGEGGYQKQLFSSHTIGH